MPDQPDDKTPVRIVRGMLLAFFVMMLCLESTLASPALPGHWTKMALWITLCVLTATCRTD